MTIGGMTPAERLRAKTSDYLEAYSRQQAAKAKMRNPWLVALGVVVLVVGIFMLAMRTNEWLDFPFICVGIIVIAAFGYPEKGL